MFWAARESSVCLTSFSSFSMGSAMDKGRVGAVLPGLRSSVTAAPPPYPADAAGESYQGHEIARTAASAVHGEFQLQGQAN